MRKLILVFFALSIMTSCVTKKRCADKFPPETRFIKTDFARHNRSDSGR